MMGLIAVIGSQIGGGDFQFQQVLAAGQMQSTRGARDALALFKNVGDVLAAVGFESERIGNGARYLVHPVDFAQGDDLLNMMGRVEPFFLQLAAIDWSVGRQVQEGQEEGLLACFKALGQQFLGVIGVMDVLAAVVGSRMSGDEDFIMINAQPFGIDFESEFLGSVEVRNGIAIGLKDDSAAASGAHRLEGGGVVSPSRQRSEAGFFLLEKDAWVSMGF